MADFGKSIELKPDDPAPYFSRGLIYQAMNDHRAALDDLTVAVNYRPDAADPHYARGVSYMACTNTRRPSTISKSPGRTRSTTTRPGPMPGQAAESLGDRAEAAQAYRRALQINSSSRLA